MRRRRPDFQAMTIPDGAFAAISRHFKILGQLEAVSGTCVFAEAAEHATRGIVSEMGQNFAAGGVVALPSHYDQILRAGEGAEIARNAERFAGFGIDIQARGATVTLGYHRALERILLGINVLWGLITEGDPHAFQQVDQKYAAQQILHRERSVPSRNGVVKATRFVAPELGDNLCSYE
jgi:hypothetical protein